MVENKLQWAARKMTVEGNSFVWREYREEGIEKGQKVREWH